MNANTSTNPNTNTSTNNNTNAGPGIHNHINTNINANNEITYRINIHTDTNANKNPPAPLWGTRPFGGRASSSKSSILQGSLKSSSPQVLQVFNSQRVSQILTSSSTQVLTSTGQDLSLKSFDNCSPSGARISLRLAVCQSIWLFFAGPPGCLTF